MPRTKQAARKGPSKPPSNPRQIPAYNRQQVRGRKIIDGRVIDLDHLSEYNIIEPFQNLGWNTFLNQNYQISRPMIEEFYAGFSFNNTTKIINLHMFEQDYQFDLQLFGFYLGVPSVGVEFYTDRHSLVYLPSGVTPAEVIREICIPSVPSDQLKLLGVHLLPECRVWNLVIAHNLYSKDGNHSHVLASQAYLLYCLKKQIQVNIAFFMASRMSGLITNQKRSLPYGMLLTKLFTELHLKLVNPVLTGHESIEHSSLEKMFRGTAFASGSKRRRSSASSSRREEEAEIEELVAGTEEEESEGDDSAPVTRAEFRELRTSIRRNTSLIQKMFDFIKAKMSCKCTDEAAASEPSRRSSP